MTRCKHCKHRIQNSPIRSTLCTFPPPPTLITDHQHCDWHAQGPVDALIQNPLRSTSHANHTKWPKPHLRPQQQQQHPHLTMAPAPAPRQQQGQGQGQGQREALRILRIRQPKAQALLLGPITRQTRTGRTAAFHTTRNCDAICAIRYRRNG